MPNISNQDMRYREESNGEHLTKDGQPDHRYKENHSGNEHSSSHITKDGQPDHRYKENRSDSEHNNGRRSNEQHDDKDDSARLADIPTKADGTADMRYTESREAVASGLIQRDEVVEEAMNGDHHQQQQGSHLKNDGTADKRYKENQNDEE